MVPLTLRRGRFCTGLRPRIRWCCGEAGCLPDRPASLAAAAHLALVECLATGGYRDPPPQPNREAASTARTAGRSSIGPYNQMGKSTAIAGAARRQKQIKSDLAPRLPAAAVMRERSSSRDRTDAGTAGPSIPAYRFARLPYLPNLAPAAQGSAPSVFFSTAPAATFL